MTARTPVGVVIATRNRADRLARTLGRLTALPEAPRVLVVDNASQDGTRALLAERYPGVGVRTLSANQGAIARNHGVRALPTPYVAFSDDDSWWEPGALATAADLLDRHPRLGLVAAGIRVGDEGAGRDPLEDELAASPLGTVPDLPGRQVLGFLGCAAVVRRSAFLDAGGYHPVLFFGAEESLLAYDLAARGWGVAYCPQVVARHDPAPGPRADRDTLLLRNALLTDWLRRPLPVVLRHTVALAAAATHAAPARRALGGALARLPMAARSRAPLPPHVENAVRCLEEHQERQEHQEPGKRERHPDHDGPGRPGGKGESCRTTAPVSW